MDRVEDAGAPEALVLLKSASEQQRLEGLKHLLTHPPQNLEQILSFIAERDAAARIRYAARKALDLWRRRQGASRPSDRIAPASREALQAQLDSKDAQCRAGAADAALGSGDARLLSLVRPLLAVEKDPAVRARMLALFEQWALPEDLPLLLPHLSDPDHRVRAGAVLAAARADLHRAAPMLMGLLADPDHRVRANSAMALAPLGMGEVTLCLERMLGDESVAMRDAAAYAAARFVDPAMLPLLRKALGDRSPMVRQKAEKGLERLARSGNAEAMALHNALTHPESVPATAAEVPAAVEDAPLAPPSLDDPNPKVRIRYLSELILDGKRQAIDSVLQRLAVEQHEFVISKLLVAIGELGRSGDARVVAGYVKHQDARVAATALEALTKLRAGGERALVRPYLAAANGRVRAAALLYFAALEPGFDARPGVEEMLSAREFEMRLAGLLVLDRLRDPQMTLLLEPVLADLSDEVRLKAVALLERRADQDDLVAKDLLEMCRQGDVVPKERSLRLERAGADKRLLALAVDALLVCVLAFLAGAGLAWGLGVLRAPAAAAQVGALASLLSGTLFFVRDGLRNGRGPGKTMVGVRVVDLRTNRGISPAKSLLRSVSLGVPGLNLVEAGFVVLAKDGRRLADRLLETQVIDETAKPMPLWQKFFLLLTCLVVVPSVIGLAWLAGGRLERAQAQALKELTEVDLTGAEGSWSVVQVAPELRVFVLERRTFLHGPEATLTVNWGQGWSGPWSEELWPRIEKDSLEALRQSLKAAGATETGHSQKLTTFAERKTSLVTLDFALGEFHGRARAAAWHGQTWLVRAVWSGKDRETIDTLTPEIGRILEPMRQASE